MKAGIGNVVIYQKFWVSIYFVIIQFIDDIEVPYFPQRKLSGNALYQPSTLSPLSVNKEPSCLVYNDSKILKQDRYLLSTNIYWTLSLWNTLFIKAETSDSNFLIDFKQVLKCKDFAITNILSKNWLFQGRHDYTSKSVCM